MDKFASRKLVMNLVALAVAVAAFWTTDKISGLEFLGFVAVCTLGYGAENALDKLFSFLHVKTTPTGGAQ